MERHGPSGSCSGEAYTQPGCVDQNIFPDAYSRPFEYSGSRPTFRKRVMQLEGAETLSDLEICLAEGTASDDSNLLETVKTWAVEEKGGQGVTEEKNMFVIASDTLLELLNLPICYPHHCSSTQMVFLGRGLPFFVLILYGSSSAETKGQSLPANDMSKFAVQLARSLTSALFYFCHCDFVLLPCTLERGKLSVAALDAEVEKQLKFTSGYFRGPTRVNASAFAGLKIALTAVAGVTAVPYFFLDPTSSKEKPLLLFDGPWFRVLTQIINDLKLPSTKRTKELTYTPGQEVKMKAAVLEAARRLSSRDAVLIVTDDLNIQLCVQKIVEQELQDHRVNLKLRSVNVQSLTSRSLTQSGTEPSRDNGYISTSQSPAVSPGKATKQPPRHKLKPKKPRTKLTIKRKSPRANGYDSRRPSFTESQQSDPKSRHGEVSLRTFGTKAVREKGASWDDEFSSVSDPDMLVSDEETDQQLPYPEQPPYKRQKVGDQLTPFDEQTSVHYIIVIDASEESLSTRSDQNILFVKRKVQESRKETGQGRHSERKSIYRYL